jgi:hypothetical protein
MPIAVISVDSMNKEINDFKDLTNMFDLVYLSQTQAAQDIYNRLLEINTPFAVTITTDKLNPPELNETDESVRIRFQSVVDECSGGKACIIISHHSVINSWKNNFIKDEWMVI